MSGKRQKRLRELAQPTVTPAPGARPPSNRLACLLAFVVGAAIAGGAVKLYTHLNTANADAGHRTVAQLMTLSDAELEKVDVLEMNIAVARDIPGLEKLDYDHYRSIVDGWTEQFRSFLPTVEPTFHQSPQKYKNDINFFRLGMLAQFLDQQVGVTYVPEQKQAQIDARKTGRNVEIRYTNPGDLLLHGLIDTKRGTCGTMPPLHVAIGRRMGWPVGLACTNSHFICRYDDGKTHYNIEATDTGRGGFAEGSDQQYMQQEGVTKKAVDCGSDLRKLTGREMLGLFVAARARHFDDTNNTDLAARDYALAHTLAPNNRKIYVGLVESLVPQGEKLFASNEIGHPLSLGQYLVGKYQPLHHNPGPADPFAEAERINAINRGNMERTIPSMPQGPQPYRPPLLPRLPSQHNEPNR